MTPPTPDRLGVEIIPVDPEDLAGLEPGWRALERTAAASPYHGWEWMAAWARVYSPRRLSLVRVERGRSEVVALGLIEHRPARRWRFAGTPVTPVRGLLCAPGALPHAWGALLARLAGQRERCWMLDAEGLPPQAAVSLGGAGRPGAPVFGFDLPSSFDSYLAARSPKTRKGLKQKLRVLRREEGTVREVSVAERDAALGDFIALHQARARDKRERHPSIDARLTALLAEIAASPVLGLRLFELVVEGERAGVTIRIDHGTTGYLYNAGIDPSRGRLSPGLLLELGSIHDAIERGLRRFDLGPGTYRYKSDLGGTPSPRCDLAWAGSSPTAQAAQMAATVVNRARRRAGANPLVRRLQVWRSR